MHLRNKYIKLQDQLSELVDIISLSLAKLGSLPLLVIENNSVVMCISTQSIKDCII